MNWISYFEKYNSDRKLLEAINLEIDRIEHSALGTGRLPQLRSAAQSLQQSILQVDSLLDNYVAAASTPKDAAKRAQEHLYLCLRYQQELTMEATAEAMDISRDTVYRIRRRILARGDIFDSVRAR